MAVRRAWMSLQSQSRQPAGSRPRFFRRYRNQRGLRRFMVGWVAIYRSAPCVITAYMRSQLVPQRSRKRWCRPNSNLRRPGALRARAIRRLRSAFVQEPSSHSKMTFKPAVSCFGRKSAIGWHGFARSPSTSRAAITTRWNFQMVQSFWSPILQLDNGPRYCNCLQAQWMKRLRRPNLRLDMRLLISDGPFAVPDVPGPSRFGPPWIPARRFLGQLIDYEIQGMLHFGQ